MKIYTDKQGTAFAEWFKQSIRNKFRELGANAQAGADTLSLVNDMLDGHGVEFIMSSRRQSGQYGFGNPDGFAYVNTGDIYNITVAFDTKSHRFYWRTIGDIVESQTNRFST